MCPHRGSPPAVLMRGNDGKAFFSHLSPSLSFSFLLGQVWDPPFPPFQPPSFSPLVPNVPSSIGGREKAKKKKVSAAAFCQCLVPSATYQHQLSYQGTLGANLALSGFANSVCHVFFVRGRLISRHASFPPPPLPSSLVLCLQKCNTRSENSHRGSTVILFYICGCPRDFSDKFFCLSCLCFECFHIYSDKPHCVSYTAIQGIITFMSICQTSVDYSGETRVRGLI